MISRDRKKTVKYAASRTDPDATPMRLGGGKTRLGYQTHHVVDGGKARVILAALVTPAEVMEYQPMLDLLWRTLFRWQLRPHHVTGDGAYMALPNSQVNGPRFSPRTTTSPTTPKETYTPAPATSSCAR